MKQQHLYPVPVVRLIVPDKTGRILILKRNHTDYAPGAWCLPGGKIDYKDTVKEAARRELFEETGLACTKIKFLSYQDSLPLETGGMHCINFYLECLCQGAIVLNHESCEYAFMAQEDFAQHHLVFRNDEGLLRYWQRVK
jgi:8-oxo-dGTP diphosphatase